MKTYSLLAGILLSFSLSIQAGDLKLWYKQPAGTWVEAASGRQFPDGSDGIWRNGP